MKVALITIQYPPRLGGVATASKRLANGLTRNGDKVLVITQKPSWEDQSGAIKPEFQQESDVDVYRFPEKAITREGYGEFLPQALKLVREFSPDIIHAYYLNPTGYFACAIAKQLGVPVTVSARGDDVTLDMLTNPGKVRCVTRNATRMLSVSQSLLDWLTFIEPTIAGTEIQNGVDPHFKQRSEEAAHWRQEQGITPDMTVIGANARFRWKKGMGHMLDILGCLGKALTEKLAFVLAGDFPAGLVEQTQTTLEKYGSKVIILNKPDRNLLPIYCSAFDLFLLTSIREGLSNSVLEAMACGVPIVSTPANGCEGVITDYECGIIISPYNSATASEAILELIEDREARTRFSTNALKAANGHFQVSREVDEHRALFEKIVSETT